MPLTGEQENLRVAWLDRFNFRLLFCASHVRLALRNEGGACIKRTPLFVCVIYLFVVAVVQVHGLVLDDVYALHGDVLLRELDHLVVVDAADHLLLRDHAFLVVAVHVGGTCCMKNRKKGRITHHSRNVSPPSYFLQFCRLLSQITRAKALKTPFSLFRYKRRYCYSVSCSLTTTRFSTWNNNLTY